MMYGLQIRALASLDVIAIASHIAADSPAAGERFINAFHAELDRLRMFPHSASLRRGVPKRYKGLRSTTITKFRNYLVFYVTHDHIIEVLRVYHGARNIRKLLRESE